MTYDEAVEQAAFAIFREFIRGAIGTVQVRRDEDGRAITVNGELVRETHDEACLRRWQSAPEVTRSNFRREAASVLAALS